MTMAYCFLAAFGLFIHGASPTVSFEDSGEMIAAAFTLGVTHPPGYPWLTMLGRLFQYLPLGDPAFRMNALSAAAGAGAVTLVFSMASLLAARIPRISPAIARAVPWISAAAFAVSRTLWWQAGIAEKYTMSVLLMLLTLHALLRHALEPRPGRLAAAVFLSGFALSHHLHGLYLVPAVALAVWQARPAWSRLVLLVFLWLLPLSAKAVAVPIRSVQNPEFNWGVPDNFGRLSYYLAARQYRFIMLSNKGPGDLAGRLATQATVMPLTELGPILALAIPGGVMLWGAAPAAATGCALTILANFGFALAYPTPEIERYYLLTYGLLALLAGLGSGALLTRSRVWGSLALLTLSIPALINGRMSPRNRHYLSFDFAVNQLASVPPGSILMTEGDDPSFPLSYLSTILGRGAGVAVIPQPFLCWSISYRAMAPHYPFILFPPFEEDPGKHLPRFIAVNAVQRETYYTPGCTGAGSRDYLVPRGVVFRAHALPVDADRTRNEYPRFPALRLRGAVDVEKYGDAVSTRAAANYSMGLAYHGAQALTANRLPDAEYFLHIATLLPGEKLVSAAALTHLALARQKTGRAGEAPGLLQKAVAIMPQFSPALLALARDALQKGDRGAAFSYAIRAGKRSELLTRNEQRELSAILGTNP